MRRLVATMRCDVRIQMRNGFYYVVAFILAAWAILISQLPALNWGYLLPVLVLGNLMAATFYFMAGLVLLEKGEGTLEAQVVTPLTTWQYLASKVLTLTALSVIESVVLVLITQGRGFDAFPLITGVVLASAIYCLAGFIVVSRYDSINEYMFPSMIYAAAFSLPFLHYFGVWESRLMYLHPLQAPLVIMKAAFSPMEAWIWPYGLLYSALWIGLTFVWSKRSFHRFIIAREGAP